MADTAPISFGDNAYLNVAYQAIVQSKMPLSPSEILDFAREEGFLPSHLSGARMDKTMAARLSENIRQESSRSAFFRTGPAKYFLHEVASRSETPDEYKHAYVGNLRTKSIRKENVLVVPKDRLNSVIYGEYIPFDGDEFKDLYERECKFVDRASAETDDTLKQFVTFTLVYFESKLLIYRRGKFTTTSDELKGQLSVGFGGHINDEDFDLFNMGSDAFRNNAVRELREELFLDDVYSDVSDTERRTEILGYVNVDDNFDARHHIAVLVAFQHKNDEIPKKGELSINQLSWLDLGHRLNDLSSFDLWSEMILRNIYQGRIKLPQAKAFG
ncbi:hypothetical protein [Parasphingorhabdus sp.]|jgi:predicted NUDIX family phosphoesterase|uniref:hypothetical protein n=1 Tax=Parasphingorhabdus sp. TaxID=2709688 RepID=UPI0039E2882F